MKTRLFAAAMTTTLILLAGCQSAPDGVVNKVLTDFGMKDKPEGYVSGSDQVMQKLAPVGDTEMKRLNMKARQGEVKFQEDGIRGMYYKEVKIYERAIPLDANATGSSTNDDRGYNGFIEYEYTMYQSERQSTRAKAEAASPTISTGVTGRETYRYNFTAGGVWDGGEGQRVKR